MVLVEVHGAVQALLQVNERVHIYTIIGVLLTSEVGGAERNIIAEYS